jgi:hypothetical protein
VKTNIDLFNGKFIVHLDENNEGGESTVIAIFSPIKGVTKPRIIRPVVIPSQNPVDIILLGNGAAWRTSFMKVTTHPPRATSTPTYPSKKKAHSQVIRAVGIVKRTLLNPAFSDEPLSPGCCFFSSWNDAPVESQKHATQNITSIAAPPIWEHD